MTTPTQPTDDELPRDPAFDDAWRALSREEPSAALDAAVRAAARREVGAGPHATTKRDGAGARAAKPMNWWRPLAVAATLGALAIGLLQLVTPERVGAPGRDGAVVSDMPATSIAPSSESAKKEAAGVSNEVATPEEKRRVMEAPAGAVGGNLDRKQVPAPLRESVAPPSQSPPSDELAQKNARKDSPPERQREALPTGAPAPSPRLHEPPKRLEPPANAPAAPAPVQSPKPVEPPANAPVANTPPPRAKEESAAAATRDADRAAVPASKVAPMPAAEPFPADKREAGTTKRDAQGNVMAPHSPPKAPAVAPAAPAAPAPPPPTDKALADKPAPENRAATLAKAKPAPEAPKSEYSAAATDSMQQRREQEAQGAPQGKLSMQAPVPANAQDAGRVQHPELSVPDWIALIRRLIAEKNFIVADKELAAFRAAHSDAQRLLPPDLRDWKAPR